MAITDGLRETYRWTATVGFVSAPLRYSLLGYAKKEKGDKSNYLSFPAFEIGLIPFSPSEITPQKVRNLN